MDTTATTPIPSPELALHLRRVWWSNLRKEAPGLALFGACSTLLWSVPSLIYGPEILLLLLPALQLSALLGDILLPAGYARFQMQSASIILAPVGAAMILLSLVWRLLTGKTFLPPHITMKDVTVTGELEGPYELQFKSGERVRIEPVAGGSWMTYSLEEKSHKWRFQGRLVDCLVNAERM